MSGHSSSSPPHSFAILPFLLLKPGEDPQQQMREKRIAACLPGHPNGRTRVHWHRVLNGKGMGAKEWSESVQIQSGHPSVLATCLLTLYQCPSFSISG